MQILTIDQVAESLMIFRLIEKTSGPWLGRVWRCEEMTQPEADARNAKISVMQWEIFSENSDNASDGDSGATSRPRAKRRTGHRIGNVGGVSIPRG